MSDKKVVENLFCFPWTCFLNFLEENFLKRQLIFLFSHFPQSQLLSFLFLFESCEKKLFFFKISSLFLIWKILEFFFFIKLSPLPFLLITSQLLSELETSLLRMPIPPTEIAKLILEIFLVQNMTLVLIMTSFKAESAEILVSLVTMVLIFLDSLLHFFSWYSFFLFELLKSFLKESFKDFLFFLVFSVGFFERMLEVLFCF